MSEDRCVCCGEIVPEGRVVCPDCEKKAEQERDLAEELVSKWARKEFLFIAHRPWDEILTGVRGVYVLPSRRKHDSGWACMDFVAEFADDTKPMIRFGGGCDDVAFVGTHFRMDCTYPHGIIHIWCAYDRTFSVSSDLSSINFVEE